jgi:hypothetical protein
MEINISSNLDNKNIQLSDNNLIVDDNIENKVKRTFTKNKKKLFTNQRNVILSRIYEIVGISQTNKSFYSNSIEDYEDKCEQIYQLEEDIQKYFHVSSWPAFKKNSKLTDKKALSIIKSVLKDMNIDIVSSCVRVKDENLNTKYATLYNIVSNI